MFAARGTVDDENARLFVDVVMQALRSLDRIARGQPVDGDFIIRIGESRTGLTGTRRFARMAISVPGSVYDGVQFLPERLECRIDKEAEIPFLKLIE